MVNVLTLAPVLILLLGALVLIPGRIYGRFRPFISLAVVLITALFLFLNARQSNPVQLAFPDAAGGVDLDLTFNWSAVGLVLVSVVLLAFVARLFAENLSAPVGPGALVTLAGVVVFLCANNWVTLIAGWVLVDLGLLSSRLGTATDSTPRAAIWRSFGISQLGAVLLLAAGVSLLNDGLSLRLSDTALGAGAATLVIFAAWIRTGFWPFHYAPPEEPDPPHSWSLYDLAITGLLGLFLLVRGILRLQEDPLYPELIQYLALLGLAAATLLALSEHGEQPRIAWAVRALGAPLFLLTIIAVVSHVGIVIWLMLDLFNLVNLALAAAVFRPQTVRQPWRQVLWGAVLLCAVGFPLTPGFLGRVGYYAAVIQGGDQMLFAAILGTTTLALIPVWRGFLSAGAGESRNPTPVEYVGLALLLLPVVIEGVLPFRVTALFGREVEDASAFAYDALVHSSSLWQPIILVGATLLPLPLSYFLARAVDPLRVRIGALPQALTTFLDLSFFSDAFAALVDVLGEGVRQLSALIELHPVGWILFAAIWVALWLLNIR